MKLYLAGMGVNEKLLLKHSKKNNNVYRRLVSFAYKKEAEKLIELKREKKSEKK